MSWSFSILEQKVESCVSRRLKDELKRVSTIKHTKVIPRKKGTSMQIGEVWKNTIEKWEWTLKF